MITICVDVGTSVIKSVAFDDDGTEIAIARQETVVMRPAPGLSEQDMYSVWDGVASTIRVVLRQVSGSVRLISLTAQGDGCWFVDTEGRPTGPRSFGMTAAPLTLLIGGGRQAF
jgi:erythritol kinase (D-erythritol 1-phosphate-forming)